MAATEVLAFLAVVPQQKVHQVAKIYTNAATNLLGLRDVWRSMPVARGQRVQEDARRGMTVVAKTGMQKDAGNYKKVLCILIMDLCTFLVFLASVKYLILIIFSRIICIKCRKDWGTAADTCFERDHHLVEIQQS